MIGAPGRVFSYFQTGCFHPADHLFSYFCSRRGLQFFVFHQHFPSVDSINYIASQSVVFCTDFLCSAVPCFNTPKRGCCNTFFNVFFSLFFSCSRGQATHSLIFESRGLFQQGHPVLLIHSLTFEGGVYISNQS